VSARACERPGRCDAYVGMCSACAERLAETESAVREPEWALVKAAWNEPWSVRMREIQGAVCDASGPSRGVPFATIVLRSEEHVDGGAWSATVTGKGWSATVRGMVTLDDAKAAATRAARALRDALRAGG